MKNYFDFKGTAKRQEYWAVLIASIVAGIIGIVITETIPLVALVVFVATLWVYLATTVRRLRDADQAGPQVFCRYDDQSGSVI